MLDNKDIAILRDGQEFHKILSGERKIGADIIFDLFDYQAGDTFEIIEENPNNIDGPVVNYFVKLLQDINEQIVGFIDEQSTTEEKAENDCNLEELPEESLGKTDLENGQL